MNKKVLSLVLMHWLIFFLYFIPASLKFVYERHPNPIGYGILMLLCMLGHIIIGLMWIGRRWRTMAWKERFFAFFTLILPMVVFMILGNPVSEILWEWRGD